MSQPGRRRPTWTGRCAVAAVMVVVVSSVTASAVSAFTDVPEDHAFAAEIDWVVAADIATGFPDDTFRPASPVTRQAMAAFLQRELLLLGGEVGAPSDPGFSDVPSTHPFYDEIAWLADAGVAGGYPDGTFRPSAAVTRQAMAAFLERFWTELYGAPGAAPNPGFSDVPTSHAFYDEIAWLADSGIAGGYADGTFRPSAAVSRQAMAAFLLRFFDAGTEGTCAGQDDIPHSECTALVALWFAAAPGGSWVDDTGWLDDSTEPCDWYGVDCTAGHVTSIVLVENGLDGTIPPQLDALTALATLDLHDNTLFGPVPVDLLNLGELTSLALYDNDCLTAATSELEDWLTALDPDWDDGCGAAADFVVNTSSDFVDPTPGDGTCGDGSTCSLRAAVGESNELAGQQLIVLDADPVLSITGAGESANVTGSIDSLDDLVIDGDGHTIDADGIDGVLHSIGADLELVDATVTGGGNPLGGFGVRSTGSLHLTDVTVSGNTRTGVIGLESLVIESSTIGPNGVGAGGGGGGVAAYGPTLEITDSTISENGWSDGFTDENGGGVYAQEATVSIDGSVISDNVAGVQGGGVYAESSTVTITETRIEDNRAEDSSGCSSCNVGGGLALVDSTSTLDQVTVSGNETESGGGGVYISDGTATIVGSTIDHNGTGYSGGGIYAGFADVDIRFSTISDNVALPYEGFDGGGGIKASSSTVDLVGVTVAGNTLSDLFTGAGPGIDARSPSTVTVAASILDDDCAVPITSGGYNRSPGESCGLDEPSDVELTNPLLEELADNGGPTLTRMPHENSPTIDDIPAGTAGLCDVTTPTDQRGEPRPLDGACDIGAVEGDNGLVIDLLELVVDTATDAVDDDPGDGVCDIGDGSCSLRAAVMETNRAITDDLITIADGIDPVIASDEEPSSVMLETIGDIDVLDRLAIDGNGATIDADDHDRIFESVAPILDLTDLTLTDGHGHVGGAVWARGRVQLFGVTITGNASSDAGGGLAASTADVFDSTISGNTAAWDGGGVSGGTISMTGSTVSGNSSSGSGGGVAATAVTLVNSTISGNTATTAGGGVRALLTAQASTIAGNTAPTGSQVVGGGSIAGSIVSGTGNDCASGTFTSGGYNVGSDTSCVFTATGDQQNADPLLAALADNGGPTLTHLPGLGSPARDAIPASTAGLCDGTIPTDQRGIARPQNGACDIGAVEQ